MSISFEGIGAVVATFKVQDSATLATGDAVTITANGTVGLGAVGALVCGVAVSSDINGYVGIQIGGLAQICYSGTTEPTVGWSLLAGDGKGGVQVVEAGGRSCLVVSVDKGAKTAVIKL